MRIFLVRHGETTGDLEDRYGGWYDDPLTDLGKEQLAQTSKKLVDKGIEIIYASPLLRARQSAEIINSFLKTELEFIEELKERNYGILGGLTKIEAVELYPEVVILHKDPTNTDPDGEVYEEFKKRVLQAFDEITKSKKKTVSIVSHGGPLKTILQHLNKPVPEKIGDGGIVEIDV